MANSMLKEDNSRGMQGTKWKAYRKRLPPTPQFFKHAIVRVSQVISRIVVLSLCWTVVGSLGFAIIIGIELVFALFIATAFKSLEQRFYKFDASKMIDYAVLSLSAIVLLPPELLFCFPMFGVVDYPAWHLFIPVWPSNRMNVVVVRMGIIVLVFMDAVLVQALC